MHVTWNNINVDFLKYFDHSSQQATWRERNKSLKFRLGDSSQTYVMSKVEILRNIDPP